MVAEIAAGHAVGAIPKRDFAAAIACSPNCAPVEAERQAGDLMRTFSRV
jgi:hypothetical protein